MTQIPLLVIGHRGASGYRPEHTRSAYELAFEQGADAVEPDLVATKDRVLVIRHENEISGTTDVASHPEFADRRTTKVVDGQTLTGWFTEDFTWAELTTLQATERLAKLRPANTEFAGEGILRLVDLLALLDAAPLSALGARIGMVAEIKHASYFASIGLPLDELFAAELLASGWTDDDRLTVECFELTVLGQIRDRGVRARYVFLVEPVGCPADEVAARGDEARTYASYLTADGMPALAASVHGISVDKHILQAADASGSAVSAPSVGTELVARAHAAGLTVFCWTLRAENAFLAKNLRCGTFARQFGDWRSEFLELMRMGVDGVFADQPDLAIEARTALTRPPVGQ
ncbi:glycerophosphodiester phosphodiesterase family protein [Frigoribacterium sp. CG_9.8]|uniref:glycerophosphodiester phosphodiesterase family protein n=1 Tax=Frigoribacterium sp. CG_9.8 TaxID=2787733 RepID=UPI001A1EAF65|nr:glycerophosphoryl diester phosphodiesterase [Frigoribacterium sp. CG_9.8]